MNIKQLKDQIDFGVDALFQAGYDMGWNSVLEEIEHQADAEWNRGNKVTAEIIRKLAAELRDEAWNDVA